MINAEKIVAQVQQGRIPTSWHVWYGRVSLLTTTLFLSAFTLFLASACELMLGGGLAIFWDLGFSLADLSTPSAFGQSSATGVVNILHLLFPLEPWLLGWPFACALLVGYLSWLKAFRARDTLLILLPEGVVQCFNFSNAAKRTCQVFDFSQINSMMLRSRITNISIPIGVVVGPVGTATALSTRSTSLRTLYWLDLQYHSGEWERWPIDEHFGPPAQTARAIMQAQQSYVPAVPVLEPLWVYA